MLDLRASSSSSCASATLPGRRSATLTLLCLSTVVSMEDTEGPGSEGGSSRMLVRTLASMRFNISSKSLIFLSRWYFLNVWPTVSRVMERKVSSTPTPRLATDSK